MLDVAVTRICVLLRFLWRVLVFSAIVSPVVAQDHSVLPAPPLPAISAEPPPPAPGVPVVGDATQPNYWIVSSRCSVQHIKNRSREPWGLDVFQRTPDGQLLRTNLASLQQSLAPGIPVCIFSHGTFVKWESQCREAHCAYQRIRGACPQAPLHMIFFTWPSDGPYTYIPPVDITVRGRRAEFNGFHLSHLIAHVPAACPVSLVGHSHGARVILSAMHLAGGGSILGHVYPGSLGNQRRYRVVLAAAAMDHHWLNPGQRYDCALHRVECLLNVRNQQDLPLAFYPLTRPFARRALARAGFTNRDVRKIGPNITKVRDIDFTFRLGSEHLWPYYYSDPAIIREALPYIYFF